MTVAGLVEYLLQEVSSGSIRPSDQVSEELIRRMKPEHVDVVEYLAGKYGIKEGDTDGQERPD